MTEGDAEAISMEMIEERSIRSFLEEWEKLLGERSGVPHPLVSVEPVTSDIKFEFDPGKNNS